MSAGELRIRRALISVSDKRGLAELARALVAHGVEILSTGGSARTLTEAGVPVTEVSDHTGFPEIMGGRVKTLHPRIHGGILARREIDDEVARTHDLPPIDLVVVNLYPFAQTVARPDCSLEQAIENIDIGGPALLRAAAKNHDRVTVVCAPEDYPALIEALPNAPAIEKRRALATRAFAHTCAYDGQISQWLAAQASAAPDIPPLINLALDQRQVLRYGENPHQPAGLYALREQPPSGVAGAELLQGKPLSYNNLLDADAAWRCVKMFADDCACAVVKHGNPCGAAVADNPQTACRLALECDPTSAFGGIHAFNRPVDVAAAELIVKRFAEVVIAPGFEPGALDSLAGKPNLRLLVPAPESDHALELRSISGGMLIQQSDPVQDAPSDWTVVTERQPDPTEWRALQFVWRITAAVRSNAIVLASENATLGIGAGQMSRVDSVHIAIMKARDQG
ncbi:MAG: bifunctional phosphoribosylaminoimidazolecarboxamide formyltransferase/IMP cyclohydrolase, partial [Wenzhouxiangellaceae bacterium]